MVRTRATTVPTPTPAGLGASEPTIGAVARRGAVARGRGRGHRRTPSRGRGKTPGPASNRALSPPPTDEVVREGEEGEIEQVQDEELPPQPTPEMINQVLTYLSGGSGSTYAAAVAPRMNASLEVGTFPRLTTGPIMTSDQHELFTKFLKFKPLVFKGAESEEAYDFLGNAKMWLRSYVEFQPAHASSMTSASFSMLFMEKYIPRTLRDKRRDEFLSLEEGRMSVTAYEAKFRALSRYATQLCFSPQERIRRFVKGLRSDLQIPALQVEGVKPDDFTMASTSKKFRKGGEYSGSYSRGQSSGGYPARPIQSSLQAVAGGPSQTSQHFSEFGETGHIRRYCPKQSYRPPIVRGGGGHGRRRHSGGCGGQGNGGHQISWGGGQVGTTAAQHESNTHVDLIILEMVDFDVILGMTWLSPNFSILDCNAKTVTLAKPGTDPPVWEGDYISTPVHIISFLRAKRMVSKGCLAFLSHVRDDTSQVPSIESVSIVREFLDVFPADLPGMPPDRDIDFCIDLESGTRPISIPPYRMAPAELRELKA
ncbi:hypothetical protein EJD97_006628 [Solanum chilense]|uniref:Retrotransposon gag domain-containing protein n=1 Tax=Solanum chilense TaxID=4083 RepID=A0A6N2BQH4_SOLCI|nr:hypothetical protein EJD97_006628 [Solanum chilense]